MSYTREPPELEKLEDTQFEVEQILYELLALVSDARSMLRSNSAIVDRGKAMELLTEAREKFPEEIRAARWLIKERKLFIEKVQQEKQEILEEAQKQAAQMVSKVEIVRESEREAKRIIHEAEEDAAKTRYMTDDFCSRRLKSFERVLDNILGTVKEGQTRLRDVPKDSIEELSPQNSLDLGTDSPSTRGQLFSEKDYEVPAGASQNTASFADPLLGDSEQAV